MKKKNEFDDWVNENFSKERIEAFVKKHKKNYMSDVVWGELLIDENEFGEPHVASIYMEELDRCRYDGRLSGTDLRQIEKFFGYPIA